MNPLPGSVTNGLLESCLGKIVSTSRCCALFKNHYLRKFRLWKLIFMFTLGISVVHFAYIVSYTKIRKSMLQNLRSGENKWQDLNADNAVVETTEKKSELKLCPPVPPNLKGPLEVHLNNVPPLDVQERAPNNLSLGGRYRPKECQARLKVAIIIPFRNRSANLAVFLYNIHPLLQRQQLDYAIFVVEQVDNELFNRATLMNIGFIEALKLYPYECFIFHDVDLLPEDDRNLYTCSEHPRHMTVAIQKFNYKLVYKKYFGGAIAMTIAQFKTVNGFSNRFWGWGGEDDDMFNRVKFHGFDVSRSPANISRYTSLSHEKAIRSPNRVKILKEGKFCFKTDGLSNVKCNVLEINFKPLCTWIEVELIKE